MFHLSHALWAGLCLLALTSCTEIVTNGEGLRTPADFALIKTEGNVFAFSGDGTTIATWVNENLPHNPQWSREDTWVITAPSLTVRKKISSNWSSAVGITAAACNMTGDTIWYVSSKELYRVTKNSTEGQLAAFLSTASNALCVDGKRSAVYVFTRDSDSSRIFRYGANGSSPISGFVSYYKSLGSLHGTQKLRLVDQDFLYTPDGFGVDVPSRGVQWEFNGIAAILSSTRLIALSDDTPVLLDINSENHLGYLKPQREQFYTDGAVASADGKRFAVIYNTSSGFVDDVCYVAVFDAVTGEELYNLSPYQYELGYHDTPITDVEFSPTDNSTIYICTKEGNLCRWRIP